MFDSNTSYALFKAQERYLFAKARDGRFSEAAKRARSYNTASANNRLTRDHIVSSVQIFWSLLVSVLNEDQMVERREGDAVHEVGCASDLRFDNRG